MRTICLVVLVGAMVALASGCAGFYRAPVVPPEGFFYSNYKAPITTEFNNTQATGKKGTGETKCILGLFAWGDASMRTAAESAGITKVEHVEYDFYNVLGVYSKFTIVVTGQ
jgi:hypothetical protein